MTKLFRQAANSIKKHQYAALLVATFLLLCVLCYLFPYTGDDWAWGSSIGMGRLNNGFDNYGGRYLGYVIVIILTRCRILRAAIMAGTMLGIGIYAKKIIGHTWAFIAAISMMFLSAIEIFAQSVSWTSGFANYATTALAVFGFLYIVMKIVVLNGKSRPAIAALMLPLGFSGCLIMENVSLYFVFMSVGLQIYLWFKEKRFSLPLFLFMVGAIAGSVWMFSNTAYRSIINEQDSYRAVSSSAHGILYRAKENYIANIYQYSVFKNVILNTLFTIGGALILFAKKDKKNKMAVVCLGLFGLFTAITIVSAVMGVAVKPKYIIYGEALFSAVALLAMFCFSVITSRDERETLKMNMILWVTFFALVAPLFVVDPIGPRNFFTPYLILVMINLTQWKSVLRLFKKRNKKASHEVLRALFKTEIFAALSIIFIFIGVFSVVYRADKNRLSGIMEKIDAGQQEIIIDNLPFASTMWDATPPNELFIERYKLFYNIPDNIKLVRGE